ncbi:hypothetical protein OUZ56_032606 [Daphnia magna]|uniref:Uncharacterized protein n=1 Tax=Daphnia magna TaxID=35525 RepID=A0ABR0B9E2_9CRUS|nr:hypothetical protein OUZ56_032606 [Daphnia magna]
MFLSKRLERMGPKVHLRRPNFYKFRGRAKLGPTQNRAHAGDQFIHAKRLCNVVIGTGCQSANLVGLLGPRGKHHNRNKGAPPAQLLTDREAVHVGEHEIEHDRVGRFRASERNPSHHDVRFVFDEEDRLLHGPVCADDTANLEMQKGPKPRFEAFCIGRLRDSGSRRLLLLRDALKFDRRPLEKGVAGERVRRVDNCLAAALCRLFVTGVLHVAEARRRLRFAALAGRLRRLDELADGVFGDVRLRVFRELPVDVALKDLRVRDLAPLGLVVAEALGPLVLEALKDQAGHRAVRRRVERLGEALVREGRLEPVDDGVDGRIVAEVRVVGVAGDFLRTDRGGNALLAKSTDDAKFADRRVGLRLDLRAERRVGAVVLGERLVAKRRVPVLRAVEDGRLHRRRRGARAGGPLTLKVGGEVEGTGVHEVALLRVPIGRLVGPRAGL